MKVKHVFFHPYIGFVFSFLILPLALSSCAPMNKDQFMNQFNAFMEEVEENHDDYSDDDWKEKNEKLEVMLDEWYPQYEEEMSSKELSTVWSKTVSYMMYQSGDQIADFWKENGENIREQMRKNADQLSDDAKELFQDALPELRKAGRDLLDNLIEGAKELQKELEEN